MAFGRDREERKILQEFLVRYIYRSQGFKYLSWFGHLVVSDRNGYPVVTNFQFVRIQAADNKIVTIT